MFEHRYSCLDFRGNAAQCMTSLPPDGRMPIVTDQQAKPKRSRTKAASRVKSQPLRVVSLFTGCGGLDLGFEAAGCETVAAVDNDFESCKTLRYNRPEWNVFEGDIRDYNPSMRDVDIV